MSDATAINDIPFVTACREILMADRPEFRDLTPKGLLDQLDIPRGPLAASDLKMTWTETRPSSWSYGMMYSSNFGQVASGTLKVIATLVAAPIVVLGVLDGVRRGMQVGDVVFNVVSLLIMLGLLLIIPTAAIVFLVAHWRIGSPTWMGGDVRADGGTYPIRVERMAQVEIVKDKLVFMILENDRVATAALWEDIVQFLRGDMWVLFGSGGKSPIKEAWHAIIMAPPVGYPLLISSSIDGEAEIYDRLTSLNALFGPEAHASFVRKRAKTVPRNEEHPGAAGAPASSAGVPDQL